MKRSILIALTTIGHSGAFNLPGLSNIFKPSSPTAGASLGSDESQLLQLISNTGNGKDADIETQARVLSLARSMETRATPSSTLLVNLDEAKKLDGDWYLQYTAPSEIDGAELDGDQWVAINASEGDSPNIETRRYGKAGSVSGGGIPVDASSTSALQRFDIGESRVMNEIGTGIGRVTVGGSYRQSDTVPLRAVVAFDTARIALDVGFTVDLSFLFDIRAAIKGGSKDTGWLETTYLSDDVRIGRGNKGSLFILTRDRDAVKA